MATVTTWLREFVFQVESAVSHELLVFLDALALILHVLPWIETLWKQLNLNETSFEKLIETKIFLA